MGKDAESSFDRAVKAIVGKMVKPDVLVGVAVNVTNTTCDVIRENAPELKQVRLNAIDDDLQTYLTIVPVEKSSVIVAIIEGERTEAIILKCSEVAKVIGKINGISFEVNGNEAKLNGGNLGGLIKIGALVGRLQTIEQAFNSHIIEFNSHTHGTPAGISVATVPSSTQNAGSTQRNQLEDTTVKH